MTRKAAEVDRPRRRREKRVASCFPDVVDWLAPPSAARSTLASLRLFRANHDRWPTRNDEKQGGNTLARKVAELRKLWVDLADAAKDELSCALPEVADWVLMIKDNERALAVEVLNEARRSWHIVTEAGLGDARARVPGFQRVLIRA